MSMRIVSRSSYLTNNYFWCKMTHRELEQNTVIDLSLSLRETDILLGSIDSDVGTCGRYRSETPSELISIRKKLLLHQKDLMHRFFKNLEEDRKKGVER